MESRFSSLDKAKVSTGPSKLSDVGIEPTEEQGNAQHNNVFEESGVLGKMEH